MWRYTPLPVFLAYLGWRNQSEDLAIKRRISAGLSTDEVEEQTERLIEQAQFPSMPEFMEAAYTRFARMCEERGVGFPVYPIRNSMFAVLGRLYEAEELRRKPLTQIIRGDIDAARYRDHLLELAHKAEDPARTIEVLTTALLNSFVELTTRLPGMAMDTEEGDEEEDEKADVPTVPLIQLMTKPGAAINEMILPLFHPDVVDLNLVKDLRDALLRNQSDAPQTKNAQALPTPVEFKGTADELIQTFLKGTLLTRIFEAEVPFKVSIAHRLEHTAIVAGSGWGKTQLLQRIILDDLSQPDPPSLIVLDSTGAMVERVQRLALFDERLRDRILIIDPAHSPALNMFDISTPRLEGYTPEQREDIQTEIIALFNYIFASDDYDLTSRMGTAFAYAVRLILSRPGSTITDLRKLLEEPIPKDARAGYAHSAFKADIDKLDEDTRDFFQSHFFTTSFAATRLQIAQRLHKVIGVPAFRRMFTASTNTLDLFADMQKGTIVLVNTNQQLLKEESYVLFGRYIIARALAAAFERATIKDPEKRKPAFLIIDEAAPYFDKTFEALLTRVRQFKLGVVIAFQHLEQAPEKLRSAIASSTSVKFAGGLGFADRRWLAREMETTPEFIGAQKKDGRNPTRPQWSQFAVFVRNATDTALSLTIPFYAIEKQPQMSEAAYEALLKRNAQRIAPRLPTPETPGESGPSSSSPPPMSEPPTPPPVSTPVPDDKLPTEWK